MRTPISRRGLLAGGVLAAAAPGMNANKKADGTPDVLFLEELLAEEYGDTVKLSSPLTDPQVVRRGALGSFAVVHLSGDAEVDAVRATTPALPWITDVDHRGEAAGRLELPTAEQGQRSHGGRHGTEILSFASSYLPEAWEGRVLRNLDFFEATCAVIHLAPTPTA